MRYFIGIDVPASTKIEIDDWRNKTWAQHAELGSVPVANLHITLAFLGQVTDQQLENLSLQLDQLVALPFELTIDQFNVWQKPPIAWLGVAQRVNLLDQLQRKVSRCARSANIQLIEREFVPHITLARKCKGLTTSPLIDPKFTFEVTRFCLFESVSTGSGVQYPIRQQWPLTNR